MTREIKFRAWDKNKKSMFYSDKDFNNDLSEFFSEIQDYRNPLSDISSTIQQLTGLTDKNGKEIYEGDIVKFCHWDDCNINKERIWKIGKIVWDEYSFRFTLDPKEPMNSLYYSKMYEVIGNIYENPDLLN